MVEHKVPGLFKRIFNPKDLMMITDAEVKVAKAAENASIEERKWHEGDNPESQVRDQGNYQDHSYLYEDMSIEPQEKIKARQKGKLTEITGKLKTVFEHFVGSYISGLFFNVAGG